MRAAPQCAPRPSSIRFGKEITCWTALLLQSPLAGFLEDLQWAFLHVAMLVELCVYDRVPLLGMVPAGMVVFVVYNLFLHLPVSIRRVRWSYARFSFFFKKQM